MNTLENGHARYLVAMTGEVPVVVALQLPVLGRVCRKDQAVAFTCLWCDSLACKAGAVRGEGTGELTGRATRRQMPHNGTWDRGARHASRCS